MTNNFDCWYFPQRWVKKLVNQTCSVEEHFEDLQRATVIPSSSVIPTRSSSRMREWPIEEFRMKARKYPSPINQNVWFQRGNSSRRFTISTCTWRKTLSQTRLSSIQLCRWSFGESQWYDEGVLWCHRDDIQWWYVVVETW